MNIPDNLKYTKNHEWLLIENKIATIGITDFAQKELGDVVYIEVDTEGENLQIEDVFGVVEAVKTVSDLFMPLSGKVVEVNSRLEENPELINSYPYSKGWIVKVKITNSNELNNLLNAESYSSLINV